MHGLYDAGLAKGRSAFLLPINSVGVMGDETYLNEKVSLWRACRNQWNGMTGRLDSSTYEFLGKWSN